MSWVGFEGGGEAGEEIAIIGESELVGKTWALVEGSDRAMSVLCRKDPSTLSGNREDSWKSVSNSSEDVAEAGLSWEVARSSIGSRGMFSVSCSGSERMSAWTTVVWALWSCRARALLSSSQVSHFHCSRCVRP